ncbi:MAG: P-II family nitrogen regulator [Pseudomonadota bacterium]
MKEIKAIVQPFKLTKIRNAFRHLKGFPGMSVSKVEGCGACREEAAQARHGVKEELTDFSPKVRIEIVAPDHMVEGIVQVLTEVAYTGQEGDGIVWVTPAERVMRIGERICLVDDQNP